MKILTKILLILSMLLVFACNSKQRKQDKLESEKSIIIKSEFKTRGSLVKEILITSPRYKQLTEGLYDVVIKNGGLSIGVSLEGSPNPQKDKAYIYSKTYDFTLYEMYPDRKMSTSRFSFNPENKLLYEYDAVYDQLKPIEFDKNLLVIYDSLSK